jgi:DNA-directed RNA polymerase subunit M/transcription elongation factor TFIIS
MERDFSNNVFSDSALPSEELGIMLSVNIFGIRTPSTESTEAILNEWDNENIRKIIILNNRFLIDHSATFNPENFIDTCSNSKTKKVLQIYLDLYHNHRRQCEKVGLSFVLVWRSLVIMRWFDFMLGNSRGSGSKEIGDELSKIINARTNENPYSSPSNLWLKDRPHLDKYPEYTEAKLHFITFLTITNLVSDTDPEMEELKIADFRIAKRLTNFANHTRTDYHSFICPICQEDVNILYSGKDFEPCGSPDCDFCNTLIILPRGRELAHCESDYCRKKYSAGTTGNSRSQPHAINKKKDQFSRKNLKKAFDSKRSKCPGCGAKKIVLYEFGTENLCWSCVKKSRSR